MSGEKMFASDETELDVSSDAVSLVSLEDSVSYAARCFWWLRERLCERDRYSVSFGILESEIFAFDDRKFTYAK